MKSKNMVKYILIGLVSAGLFLCAFALIDMLIHPDRTFVDGFKSVLDYVLAVCFGCSIASAVMKRDKAKNEKNKDQ